MLPVRQSIGGLGNLMFKQAYIIAQVLDGNIPDVYVQSPTYFGKHWGEIQRLFSEGLPEKNDKVSLHIRRGDYLKGNYHTNIWNIGYYQKAIALFPEDKFIVFCKDNQGKKQDVSDREWCVANLTPLLGDRFQMAPEDNDEIQDLNLMASCRAHIMANSTFSWWACALGGGMTVCPKESTWFTDGVVRVDLLDDWIKL